MCVSTETETELNLEVAFSEQALTYRENHQRLRVTTSPNSPDDKLPVSDICVHTHVHKWSLHSLSQLYVSLLIHWVRLCLWKSQWCKWINCVLWFNALECKHVQCRLELLSCCKHYILHGYTGACIGNLWIVVQWLAGVTEAEMCVSNRNLRTLLRNIVFFTDHGVFLAVTTCMSCVVKVKFQVYLSC